AAHLRPTPCPSPTLFRSPRTGAPGVVTVEDVLPFHRLHARTVVAYLEFDLVSGPPHANLDARRRPGRLHGVSHQVPDDLLEPIRDRKSTRLNSNHAKISY